MTLVQTVWLVLAFAGQAQAVASRPVDVKFESGRVWMTARRATLAQILAAWTRAGKTRFEGVEKARDPGPIDAQLAGVSEDEALAFLLKPAGGYTAVVRKIRIPAESAFARVVIIGSKSAVPAIAPIPDPPAPPEPPEPAPPPEPGSVVQPALGPDGLPIPDDQQDAPPFRSMPPGFDPPPDLPPPPPSGPDGK